MEGHATHLVPETTLSFQNATVLTGTEAYIVPVRLAELALALRQLTLPTLHLVIVVVAEKVLLLDAVVGTGLSPVGLFKGTRLWLL